MKNKKSILIGIILVIIAAWQFFSGNGYFENSSDIGVQAVDYEFRTEQQLEEHYKKHGIDMGFDSPEEYEDAASDVVSDPDALHKLEEEDNDHVYYLEETNDFVIISQDGYIRTYFNPDDGIEYFNRQ